MLQAFSKTKGFLEEHRQVKSMEGCTFFGNSTTMTVARGNPHDIPESIRDLYILIVLQYVPEFIDSGRTRMNYRECFERNVIALLRSLPPEITRQVMHFIPQYRLLHNQIDGAPTGIDVVNGFLPKHVSLHAEYLAHPHQYSHRQQFVAYDPDNYYHQDDEDNRLRWLVKFLMRCGHKCIGKEEYGFARGDWLTTDEGLSYVMRLITTDHVIDSWYENIDALRDLFFSSKSRRPSFGEWLTTDTDEVFDHVMKMIGNEIRIWYENMLRHESKRTACSRKHMRVTANQRYRLFTRQQREDSFDHSYPGPDNDPLLVPDTKQRDGKSYYGYISRYRARYHDVFDTEPDYGKEFQDSKRVFHDPRIAREPISRPANSGHLVSSGPLIPCPHTHKVVPITHYVYTKCKCGATDAWCTC
jgi:hypothetical protein